MNSASSIEEREETSLQVRAGALPAAFAIAILAKVLVLPGWIFWYFFTVPTHEWGHTLVAWAGGRVAVPLGAFIPMAGFTTVYPAQSNAVIVVDAALLGAVAWFALKSGSNFLLALAAAGAFVCYQLSFVVPEKEWLMLLSWGGVGGEFWISTLLLISFYYRFPEGLRWDFFRFLALIPGAWTFVNVYWTWYQISRRQEGLPLGSFLDGRNDANGDLQKVMDFGWSVPTIVSHYMKLGLLCSAVIVGHYLYFLLASKRRS